MDIADSTLKLLTARRSDLHNTKRLVRECRVGIGLRKKGITDPDYMMSPRTVDDSR